MKKNLTTLILSIAFITVNSINVFSKENENISYYMGESKMYSPEGVFYASSVSLIKRTIEKEKKQIQEDVFNFDLRRECSEFLTTFSIEKNKFDISDEEKTFNGMGNLIGDEWNWSGWNYETTLSQNMGYIKGEDKIINNEIIAKKDFYNKDNKLQFVFKEHFKPISKEFFDIMIKNLNCHKSTKK
ncbi:MAG: hypothetical protein U0457_10375 [Candidatus Sericytochromatia bacterium]